MKKIFKISIIAIMTFAIIVPIHPILSTVTKPKVTATDSLVIIHPHSADFAAHVISAFQKWYLAETGNSIIVTTIEKDSGAALAEVLAWNGVSPLADIYWGGGEFNFEQARLAGLLVRYNVTEDGNITRFLSGWHLKDDSDLNLDPSWYGAAISGFGIMYNKEVLAAEGLPIPTTWDDLTKHEYFGQITMANPDFSGSTTATVKMILMEKNNQTNELAVKGNANMSEGLAFWTKLAGNVGLFTTSSSAVPASVYDGTFGIGLAIDYYAWDYIALSEAIGFTYGGASTFSPDPVAILLGATNMPQAEKFMDYIMSTDGQSKVGKYRIPANKEAVPESLRIPRAWDDTGNINPDFPLIDPFNVSLDGAIHTETRKFFDNYYIKNSDKLSQAWDAIGKATDATARDNAIALLTKLPSNFDGTFAGFDAVAETDPNVQGNWTSEGATNFDAAKAEAPKDYGNPINPTTTTTGTGTQPTTTDEGTTQVPGFEALLLLGGFGVLVIFRRKRR